MKKIISVITVLAMVLSMVVGVYASTTEINDGLNDASNMYSHSDNLIFETKPKLGSYENPYYATSSVGQMEIVYNMDNIAGYEVVCLDYTGVKDIHFYASSEFDGDYEELTDYSMQTEELGSSWTKDVYTSNSIPDDKNYFKIIINQSKSKYIRLDNVKLMTKAELVLDKAELSNDEKLFESDNIYGADTLTLTFNQDINYIPDLHITSKSGNEEIITGKCGAEKNIVIYNFEALGFDKYSFSANGFTTPTQSSYDLSFDKGYSFDFIIADKVHFGDNYTPNSLISNIVDSDGNEITADSVVIESDDNSVIEIGDNDVKIKKAGTANIIVKAVIDGTEMVQSKQVYVCEATKLIVDTQSLKMKKGDVHNLDVKIELSDNTTCNADNIIYTPTDNTVVSVENGNVKAIGTGNAYINIQVEYNGQILKTILAVGVDCEPLQTISQAKILFNKNEIVVGQSIASVVKGYYSDFSEADMIASTRKLYSDNEDVVKVIDNTKIIGVGEGTAIVYADINLGGATIRTESVMITVTGDYISRAKLILPRNYITVNSSMNAEVEAYSKTGKKIVPDKVVYSLGSKALTLSDNELLGAEIGECNVKAVVTYNGKSITTNAITVNVCDNNGLTEFNFAKKGTFDDTISHSEYLIVEKGVGVLCNTPDNAVIPQEVVMYSSEEFNTLTVDCYAHTSIQKGEITVFVSEDNVIYNEIPLNDIKLTTTLDEGVWYNYKYEYSGDLIKNMRYVKVVMTIDISSDTSRAQTTQAIRLKDVKVAADNNAEVIGVSMFDNNNMLTYGTKARNIAIAFSQSIDKTSVNNIKLTDTTNSKAVETTGRYEDGVYYMSIPELDENNEYLLLVSGIKNMYGTTSDDYTFTITKKDEGDLSVDSAIIDNGKAKAVINNKTNNEIKTDIIVVSYASNGYMNDIEIDKNVTLKVGENQYVSEKSFNESDNIRVYLWDSFDFLSKCY